MQNCTNSKNNKDKKQDKFHLIVLDPGHFHAALLQKTMYRQIDSTVQVFAPSADGPEVKAYLNLIDEYNNRAEDPTHWNEKVYSGPDYLQKMLQEKSAQNAIVVIAGNNKKKTDYITKSIEGSLNVLADKPMAITPQDFEQLKKAFETAKGKKVLLYDIMTERYALTNILQKMFVHLPEVFGELKKGTEERPSIIFKSVHHFYKEVSGKPAMRPVWYFDVDQQGEGIVDVTTHLIDLIQWECFPQTVFNYKEDIRMLSARHWPTPLNLEQFSKVTGVDAFPAFLQKDVKEGTLNVYANGEINYMLKGIHTQVGIEWRYVAPEGSGDTYYSAIHGTNASLVIYQDKAQDYKPALYIKPVNKNKDWQASLHAGMDKIHQNYPGVKVKPEGDSLRVIIPDEVKTGHEQRFSGVVKKYLQYLEEGKLPEWERSFMLTKYYTTTKALEVADSK
jgi:predicted dehydrogenase